MLEDFNKEFLYSYFSSKEKLNTEYILIDTFEGRKGGFRIVHLPTYVLYAPEDWQAGDIIREEFDFYLPKNIPPGKYEWKIGLYAVPKLFFIETADKNLVSGTEKIDLGTVEFKTR